MVKKRNQQLYMSASPEPSSSRNRNRRENLYPDLKRLTKSYESDHEEEYDDSRQGVHNLSMLTTLEWIQDLLSDLFSLVKKNKCITIIFLFIFILVLIRLCSNAKDETSLLKRYKQQINGILKKNFTTEYQHGINTKAVLRLIGEKWIYQKPTEPYVVLITGTKADILADALGDVFSNVTEKGEIDRIFCNEYKKRQLLESEVAKSLSKYSKSVILHGIDKLRGHAPLYLHSLSDPDHSPFRSALILLTINLFFGSHPICEDAISSHLLNVWDSDYIGEDQIRPILSRISSFLICLED
ncbi:unnamed protein product [Onchocerca ochengi]|uniref:Torsin n=1 Tax=Onchocerca ochengi TaxID=42157 RepID=A0A182E712_ONCOC|nr:unnamed protein product [Onchocerca ochengi]